MEIVFYILVGLGILILLGKTLFAGFAILGSLISVLIPIAVICAVIYFITLIF
tara:strand:+ start:326 stop:484 length:159 start_codon:yes stop_codon:yes gene_type:complete